MAGIGSFSRRQRDRPDDQLPLTAGPVSNGEFVPSAAGPSDRKVNALIRASIDDAARRVGVDRRRFLQGAGAVAASLAAFEFAGCGSPPAPQATTIPKDAVPNPDGRSYIWTDKQGKKWVYAKTPFGVTKSAVSDAAVSGPNLSTTKAIDKGDTVRFERPSPFGTMSWEKKKSDLTDDERHLLDTQPLDTQNARTEQKND